MGACVYCGATGCELGDEHIVPLSLGGHLKLYDASCKSCEDITKKFEQIVARNMFGAFRTFLQLPTRRKKDRPNSFLVKNTRQDGTVNYSTVPANIHPSTLTFVTWGFPRLLGGNQRPDGKTLFNMIIHIPDKSRIVKTFDHIDAIEFFNPEFDQISFARLLAKIAYTFGIYKQCIKPSANSQLPWFILGNSNEYFDFVGEEPVPEDKPKQILTAGV